MAALSQVEVPPGFNFHGHDPFGCDRRIYLVPSAKLLIVVPTTQDRLVLYRVDIEELLAKSDRDYLVVLSQAPREASRGKTYSYPINVKSRKGGVICNIESGPKGMHVSRQGLLTWDVPADFAEARVDVILTITDASGQKVLHTFTIDVSE